MALPREQLGESVRILKEAGIVPETYEAHQLWGEERAGVNYLPLIM